MIVAVSTTHLFTSCWCNTSERWVNGTWLLSHSRSPLLLIRQRWSERGRGARHTGRGRRGANMTSPGAAFMTYCTYLPTYPAEYRRKQAELIENEKLGSELDAHALVFEIISLHCGYCMWWKWFEHRQDQSLSDVQIWNYNVSSTGMLLFIVQWF